MFFLSLSLSLFPKLWLNRSSKNFEKQEMFKRALPRLAVSVLREERGGGVFKDQLDWEMGVTNLSKMGWWTWCWQPATMAGDFTQEQPLTRHCQKTCHLRQTRQLTRMQLGMDADQFPKLPARHGSDSGILWSKVKKKIKKIKTQVQFVWSCLDILSTLCLHHKPAASGQWNETKRAADFKLQLSADGFYLL